MFVGLSSFPRSFVQRVRVRKTRQREKVCQQPKQTMCISLQIRRAHRKRARNDRDPVRAGSGRARDRQGLRLPVWMVRPARVVAGLDPRLARGMGASGRAVLVSHRRLCPCNRRGRSARDTGCAARIAMARIGDQVGQPDLEGDQARPGHWRAGFADTARACLNAAVQFGPRHPRQVELVSRRPLTWL